jgi:hypothetical protein
MNNLSKYIYRAARGKSRVFDIILQKIIETAPVDMSSHTIIGIALHVYCQRSDKGHCEFNTWTFGVETPKAIVDMVPDWNAIERIRAKSIVSKYKLYIQFVSEVSNEDQISMA